VARGVRIHTLAPREISRIALKLEKTVFGFRQLERREVESKLAKLKQLLNDRDFSTDPRQKLLIFTEH
jgi:hypothetical protein